MVKSISLYVAMIGVLFLSMNSMAERMDYMIRKADFSDKELLKELYKKVSAVPGGLARIPSEITDGFIEDLLLNGITRGLMLVVVFEDRLIGAMTKYKVEPGVFSHVLTGGNILMHPDFQGCGIGTRLIQTFLREIEEHRPDILRVEILVRESNPAINLYKRMGFQEEGRFEQRIRAKDGSLEADVALVWKNPYFSFGGI